MAAIQDFKDIVSYLGSELGLLAGAIGLAGGLVRGAKTLEEDANPAALKYVSGLLTEGNLRDIGKAGAGMVPFIFDRVFGPKSFSLRFVFRSILASTLFWIILLLIKHANWKNQIIILLHNWRILFVAVPVWYMLDWLSLVKARMLITLISQRFAVLSSMLFLALDLSLSYILAFVMAMTGGLLIVILTGNSSFYSEFRDNIYDYFTLVPISEYLFVSSEHIDLTFVLIPSTLLTSVWTFLLFVSCLLAQLLTPLDYLRRFTKFWFKDVEHKPLTAIAKVAASLIVVGAVVVKAVRWI